MLGVETIFATLPQLLAASAILCLATALYVLLGFGSGMIAVGALALILPELRDVVVLLLLVSLPAELWVVLGSRRAIRWRGVLAICAGIAVGVPAGTWLLSASDPTFLLLLLGAFLVATGTTFLAFPGPRSLHWPIWAGPGVGLVSGVLSGAFGTGGPPLILYYSLAGAGKAAFRANLMAVFLLVTLVRVPSYAVAGLITPVRLWSGLLVLPAVLLGAALGHLVHVRLAEQSFRRLVSLALVALGLVLIARQV